MRRVLGSALLLGLGLTAGCKSGQVRDVHNGHEVLIKRGHVHTKYCGHYRAGKRWFWVRNHKHAVNCGHELEEGVWVLDED